MPQGMLPKGLRARLVTLVIACVLLPTALMLVHEIRLRREIVQRASAESALLSRLATSRAEHRLAGPNRPPPTRDEMIRVTRATSLAAAAVLRTGGRRSLPETISFVIVDRNGDVLARPFGAGFPRKGRIAGFVPGSNGSWEQRLRDTEGHDCVVSFTPVSSRGEAALWIGAGIDLGSLLAEADKGLWLSLGSVALLGLLVALLVWWGVSVAVLPRLNALLAVSEKLRRGDLGARTGLGNLRGELGALARQLDSMAEQLERRRNEQARVEGELRVSEARKSAVLEASFDGILQLDGHGQVLECNAAARRMFGCRLPRCVHHRLTDLFPDAPSFDSPPLRGPGELLETQCARADRSRFPVELSISPVRDAAAAGLFVATVRDITDRKRWEHSLVTLSYMDSLTGLHNRRGFLMFAAQQLKLASRNDRPVVLVGVDLDGLKQINDTWGHANGDRALVELARVLRTSFRESDVIGRIGGDEFVVLATESNAEGAEQALGRLSMRLAGRNGEGDLPWRLSASVGWVRTVPREVGDLETLLEEVDARMYLEKRSRREGAARSPGTDIAPPFAALLHSGGSSPRSPQP